MLQKNGPAQLHFGDASYTVVVPGSHVLCAITGKQIPLDELCYWSVEFQEAYADATIAHKALSVRRKS